MKLNNYLKILIVVLILVFYGLGLVHQINLTTDDLGRHLKNGEIIWQAKSIPQTNFYSYTYPDELFLNHHWLAGLIFYFIFNSVGFNGLIIFKTILLLAAFLLVFLMAVKKGNFWLAAIFSLPIIFILNERTDIRPEIFSYFLIALFLYFLIFYAPKPGLKIFWLVPLQLFWVNAHIYFPLGILMTGGYALEQFLKQRSGNFLWGADGVALSGATPSAPHSQKIPKTLLPKKFLLLLLFLIFASFINPAGLKGALYPFQVFQNYGYQIVENKSPFFLENLMSDPAILFFKIIAPLLLLSFLFNLKRFSFFFFSASLAVVLAGAQMVRNLPLVGLIALPVLSYNLKALSVILRAKARRIPRQTINPRDSSLMLGMTKERLETTFYFLFIAFLLFLILLTLTNQISLNRKQMGLGLTFQSLESAAFFKEQEIKGPIFNNYDIGGYLIYALYPQEKVFVDNRPEAYPAAFFEDIYKPMQSNEEKWQIYSEKYNFNVIFFTHQEATPWGRQFLSQRFKDKNWALVYADSQAVIFLKNNSANEALIKKFQIRPENIEEKIAVLLNSKELKIKMAAVNLLGLIGRDDLALKLAQEILKDYPSKGEVYLEIASFEAKTGRIEDLLSARRRLEKAIELGEDFPSVYNQLGLIYFELNQFEEAKKAWQKTLKINRKDEVAKDYLKQYRELNLSE